MSYTTYDFSETLSGSGIFREEVASVEAAWGRVGDGNEWEGGFVLSMRDGRRLYISGWCDYTGWGCQDGTTLVELGGDDQLPSNPASEYADPPSDWDMAPADLQRYIETGEGAWD